jgi:hypothetical protein
MHFRNTILFFKTLVLTISLYSCSTENIDPVDPVFDNTTNTNRTNPTQPNTNGSLVYAPTPLGKVSS